MRNISSRTLSNCSHNYQYSQRKDLKHTPSYRISFAAKTEEKDKPVKYKSKLSKLAEPNRLTGLANLVGGGLLLLSSILPSGIGVKNNTDKIPEPTVAESTILQKATRLEDIQNVLADAQCSVKHDYKVDTKYVMSSFDTAAENMGLERINPQELLKTAGMGVLGAGMALNGLGLINAGNKTKQPSEIVAGGLALASSPFVIFQQSMPALGVFYAAIGMFFSGFANKIENDLNPDKQPIEFDLAMLKDPKNWKNALCSKDESKKMALEIAKALKHVANDQRKIFVTTLDSLKQLGDYVTGGRKDKPEIFTTAPSAEQRRVSGALMEIGGVMLFVASGPLGGLANVVAGLGSVGDNMGIYALGKEQKGWARPAIMVSAVTKQVGEALLAAYPNSSAALGTKFVGCWGPNELQHQILEKADNESRPVKQEDDEDTVE